MVGRAFSMSARAKLGVLNPPLSISPSLRPSVSLSLCLSVSTHFPAVLKSTALITFSWITLISELLYGGIPLIMMEKTYH